MNGSLSLQNTVHFGEEVLPLVLVLPTGDDGLEDKAMPFTPWRGGRRPQSIGAFSPHFT